MLLVSVIRADPSVRTAPGAMAFTRIRNGASSRAMCWEKAITPPFDAAYIDRPTMLGLMPSREAMLMIEPRRTCEAITRAAARHANAVLQRLVRSTESKSSGVTSWIGLVG